MDMELGMNLSEYLLPFGSLDTLVTSDLGTETVDNNQDWRTLCTPPPLGGELETGDDGNPDLMTSLFNEFDHLAEKESAELAHEHSYAAPLDNVQSRLPWIDTNNSDSGRGSSASPCTSQRSSSSPDMNSHQGRSYSGSGSCGSDCGDGTSSNVDILDVAVGELRADDHVIVVEDPPLSPIRAHPSVDVVMMQLADRVSSRCAKRPRVAGSSSIGSFTIKHPSNKLPGTLPAFPVSSRSQLKSKYPPLQLTDEEKRLLDKEGVKLPTHYPLTKNEERQLKAIRRKIRNKRSAQVSRKRKQQYLDQMEERVEQCAEENEQLLSRVNTLVAENESLRAQVKKLQTMIMNGSRRSAQAGTCLAVLLLSFALLLAPNMSPFGGGTHSNESDGDTTSASKSVNNADIQRMPVAGRSRTLLHAIMSNDDDDATHPTVKFEPEEPALIGLDGFFELNAMATATKRMKLDPGVVPRRAADVETRRSLLHNETNVRHARKPHNHDHSLVVDQRKIKAQQEL